MLPSVPVVAVTAVSMSAPRPMTTAAQIAKIST